MREIKNIVLKGGGVLGTAYAGAYKVLQENDIIGFKGGNPVGKVEKIAGNSAGAIFATLMALGYSPKQLWKITLELDFTTFLDFDLNGLKDGGLLKGEAFLSWMDTQVENMIGNKNGLDGSAQSQAPIAPSITFRDLHEHKKKAKEGRFKDLHIYALNLSTQRTVHFSFETTPDTPIACAVRASMSIPLVFQPYLMPAGTEYAGVKFVDGGVKYNFPITAFDTDGPNYNTLGLDLTNFSYSTEDEDMLTLAFHLVCSILRKNYKGDLKEFDKQELALECYYNYKRNIDNLFNTDFDKVAAPKSKKAVKTAKDPLSFHFDNNEIAGVLNSFAAEKISMDSMMDTLAAAYIRMEQKLSPNAKASDVGKMIDAFKKLFGSYLSILKPLSVLIQTQNNTVFDRDSNRTIYLDCLGIQFTDFGIPNYNKMRLIQSGIQCTEVFLDMIMY